MVIAIINLILLLNKGWRARAIRDAQVTLRFVLSTSTAVGACLSGTVALPPAAPDALSCLEYGT